MDIFYYVWVAIAGLFGKSEQALNTLWRHLDRKAGKSH
jgi:hypothetical protein